MNLGVVETGYGIPIHYISSTAFRHVGVPEFLALRGP